MLNRVKEELPSTSDITKVDDIELQEVMENASKSMEDLISQLNTNSPRQMIYWNIVYMSC